jgi:Raf kinase inhibitor-like YbhB/YbcL family protein
MKRFISGFVVPAVVILTAFSLSSPAQESSKKEKPMIKVTSSAFIEGELIPARFTADGDDVNPTLFLESVPSNVRSLVLIVDDPDAPVGTWNHWLVWNIDPKTKEIRENTVPDKAEMGMNDFGKRPYGGPAPPSGVHRYFFKIYALDTVLDLPRSSKRAALDKAMQGHIVGEGQLMGKYTRKR